MRSSLAVFTGIIGLLTLWWTLHAIVTVAVNQFGVVFGLIAFVGVIAASLIWGRD
jgi:hypothetical protein